MLEVFCCQVLNQRAASVPLDSRREETLTLKLKVASTQRGGRLVCATYQQKGYRVVPTLWLQALLM